MLYAFQNLRIMLDDLDYPTIDEKQGFQVIKSIDFESAFKNGDIEFTDDGIYITIDGRKYAGYMYINDYFIKRYNSFPKIHTHKCTTIQSFIDSGIFRHRYSWSNSSTNDVTDKETKETYNDQVLDLCNNCRKHALSDIECTESFFDSLEKDSVIEEQTVEVDIFGYTRDWHKISKEYRKIKSYTCENCNVKPRKDIHKKWWHSHHINGDKTNNNSENLKCLCIKCHAAVDSNHRKKFSKGTQKKQLQDFLKIYFPTIHCLP